MQKLDILKELFVIGLKKRFYTILRNGKLKNCVKSLNNTQF